jgi:ribosomal protein L36
MKRVSSLKNARKRHADIQVVRRGKHVYLIVPGSPNSGKYKAKQ